MVDSEGQKRKFIRMTVQPVEKLVRQMFIPTVITMLITSLYNLVDTFFVGRLGASATGAIGTIFPMMAVIQAIGFGFGHGSGNYVSRKLGERKVREATIMATVGFVSSFITGVIILIVGLLMLSPLVRFLGVTDTIYPYAKNFLCFILLGAPFFSSSLTLNNLLRLQGNANIAMLGITAGAVLNACLDPLFIFTLGFGFTGAGLSTFISQIFSFTFLLIGNEHGNTVKLRFFMFRPSRARYIAIIQGGSPSLGRQGMRCVANVLLNHAMKIFGDEVYAAMTIVIRLANLVFAVAIGIGQGFQPVCGFNYGAKLYKRVLNAYHYAQRVSTIILFTFSVCLFIFARTVTSWFSNDPYVLEVAVRAIHFQCLSIPFMGFANIASMLFQNINKYKEAFITAIGRDGIFFFPAILFFPKILGLTGVMIAQPVADICTFFLALPLLFVVTRKIHAM